MSFPTYQGNVPLSQRIQSDCCQSAPAVLDANRVMNLLDDLVKQAEDLSCFVASKLASIVHSEPPSTGVAKPLTTEMSPLFSEYRDRIEKIQESVSRVRRNIERVEV